MVALNDANEHLPYLLPPAVIDQVFAMSKFKPFLFGAILGAGLTVFALQFHVVHSHEGVRVVPRTPQASLGLAYADIRGWDAEKFTDRPELVRALVANGSKDLIAESVAENAIESATSEGGTLDKLRGFLNDPVAPPFGADEGAEGLRLPDSSTGDGIGNSIPWPFPEEAKRNSEERAATVNDKKSPRYASRNTSSVNDTPGASTGFKESGSNNSLNDEAEMLEGMLFGEDDELEQSSSGHGLVEDISEAFRNRADAALTRARNGFQSKSDDAINRTFDSANRYMRGTTENAAGSDDSRSFSGGSYGTTESTRDNSGYNSSGRSGYGSDSALGSNVDHGSTSSSDDNYGSTSAGTSGKNGALENSPYRNYGSSEYGTTDESNSAREGTVANFEHRRSSDTADGTNSSDAAGYGSSSYGQKKYSSGRDAYGSYRDSDTDSDEQANSYNRNKSSGGRSDNADTGNAAYGNITYGGHAHGDSSGSDWLNDDSTTGSDSDRNSSGYGSTAYGVKNENSGGSGYGDSGISGARNSVSGSNYNDSSGSNSSSYGSSRYGSGSNRSLNKYSRNTDEETVGNSTNGMSRYGSAGTGLSSTSSGYGSSSDSSGMSESESYGSGRTRRSTGKRWQRNSGESDGLFEDARSFNNDAEDDNLPPALKALKKGFDPFVE